MKLVVGIEKKKEELLGVYADVRFKEVERIKMSKNSNTSNYISQEVDIESVEVELIENRQDIEGEIDAFMVVFEVRLPRKRKYMKKEVYYREI